MASEVPTLFASLLPSQIDQAWFPCALKGSTGSSLNAAEEAYENWRLSMRNTGDGVLPYGKSQDTELNEREETYVSASDNSSDDDLDTDVLDDQDSLQDVDIDINSGNGTDINPL